MKFRNEYSFLSNMYECPIVYHGIKYRCAEAAFQALKDLSRFKKSLLSVAIVPVGITQFRETPLKIVDKHIAEETIKIASAGI